MLHRLWPLPVGSRLISALQTHFMAAASSGKCPRARAALRMRALMDSIAFVEQVTLRISTSKERKGTNSVEAFSHSLITAGYLFPQASWNSPNRSVAAQFAGETFGVLDQVEVDQHAALLVGGHGLEDGQVQGGGAQRI